jgi:C-terminal binding protein
MKQQVFVLDSAQVPHAHDVEVEREVLDAYATVELLHLNSEADFEPLAERAAGIILWHQLDLTARIIPRLARTKVIVRNGVGYENVDVDSATECGIPVCNVPDYGTEEVADHAIMLCLALERELRILLDDVGRGNWRWQTASACRRVRGQVFGVVGCGRIGTATALRAKAFGFEVRFYDPYVASGYEKALGVGRDNSLEELLAKADVVSLHVPLTGETQHMIDTPQLQGMKREAFLINTSRGPVIRRLAIEQALCGKWIAGAALDVLEDEPLGLDLLSRFYNCILTPHSAFYSQESIVDMRRSSAAAVRDALLDRRLSNQVNRVSVRKVTAV